MRWLLLVGVVSAWDTQPQCNPIGGPNGGNPKGLMLPAPWPPAYGVWGAATYCDPASVKDGVKKGGDANWMFGSMHLGTCYHGGEGAGSACECTSTGLGGSCACVMQYHEDDAGWCFHGPALTCTVCPPGQYKTGCGCNGTIAKVRAANLKST